MIHTVVTQLGNVNQTFEIPRNIQTRKSTKTSQTSNFTFNQLTNLEVFDLIRPRVSLQLANGQPDAATFAVNADDLYLYFLSDLQYFTGVDDPIPGNLGHVDQSISSADVDESTKICEAGDTTLAHFAFTQFFQDFVADHIARFGTGSTLTKDQAMALPVDFDNTNSNRITNKTFIFGFGCLTGHGKPAAETELGSRDEATYCRQRNQQPAFVITNHGGF